MTAPLVASSLATLTAVAGTVTLVAGQTPYAASAATLVAVGMLTLTVVSVAGLLVARGRWSRLVAAGGAATWLGVAAASPLGPASTVLITLAAATLAALLGPWLGRWLRRLPPAGGPSPPAAALLLGLTATPAAAGLASPGGAHPALWAWGLWSLALAVAVARATPGSLIATRIGHGALALAVAAIIGFSEGLVAPIVASVPVALAWRRQIRIELVPVEARRGDAVPFPPELVHPDVLAAAGLDDRGHRREEG